MIQDMNHILVWENKNTKKLIPARGIILRNGKIEVDGFPIKEDHKESI